MNAIPLEAVARSAAPSAAEPAAWPLSRSTQPHGIGVDRYIDPAFAGLEFDKLWNCVWQVAARLDEIPHAGDYTTYDIGHKSVFVVRTEDGSVKAYRNACPHRGTALTPGGCGHFAKGRIVCPFHGWRWDLGGRNQFVLERQEFKNGQLQDSDVALHEVKCVVFAGLIFINFARDPQPFDEFIAPVRHWIEGLAIGEMHHYWWKSIPVPANWKIAQEAFFEAYHVAATHPQLEKVGREMVYSDRTDSEGLMCRNLAYEIFANGHGRFYGGEKTPMAGHLQEPKGDPLEAMIDRLTLIVEGMDAMVLKEDVDVLRSLRGKPIPPDSSLGREFAKALYAQAAEQQRPMPRPVPEITAMWGGEIFIFPNFMILPQGGNAEMYRSRPDPSDPNRCIFEIWSLKTYPAAVKPPRATVQQVTDLHDPEQLLLIPRQDLGNIPRIQKGLRSGGLQQTWLASHQEKIILNMHQELDRYLRA